MLWCCSACGLPGVKNLARHGYCVGHLSALVRRFEPSSFRGVGVGLPMAVHECGARFVLSCVLCGATWVGIPLERCAWCLDALSSMLAQRRRHLLTAPDVDQADKRYRAAMTAWAAQLREAVDVGLIDRQSATSAWQRSVNRVA